MQTLSQFIAAMGITMSAERVESNPNMESDAQWARSATHWKCALKCQRRKMTAYFSQGSAFTREPTVADVLDCLASDATSVENSKGFEDWASDLGYDSDSRKAESAFRACVEGMTKLRHFLGSKEAYETLLWQTERL